MYHNLIAVFLMYFMNNLYESSARQLELQITGPDGRSYKNNILNYEYINQQSIELTCRLLNNQTKFEMFWMIDRGNGGKSVSRADPLRVELVGGNITVQCNALELPAGDGTTNLTSFVAFVRDTQTPATPTAAFNVVKGESAGDGGKRAVPTWHVVLYGIAAAVAVAVVVALLVAKCLCKRSSNKRLLEFELGRGETEAPVYVTPRDQVRGEPPPLSDYIEPFQQTEVDLMYSTPVPKRDRTILKNEMERDNNGSYEYVTLDKHTAHAHRTAHSGNARYVNG